MMFFRIPLQTYALLAFLTVSTMGLSNTSLGYLNYPTQVSQLSSSMHENTQLSTNCEGQSFCASPKFMPIAVELFLISTLITCHDAGNQSAWENPIVVDERANIQVIYVEQLTCTNLIEPIFHQPQR